MSTTTKRVLVGILALVAVAALVVKISVDNSKSSQIKKKDAAITAAHHARDVARASTGGNVAWLQAQGATIQAGAIKGAVQVAADVKAAADRAAAIKRAAAAKRRAAAAKKAAVVRAFEVSLDSAIVATGKVQDSQSGNQQSVSKADCTPINGLASDGSGNYYCDLTLVGGGSATFTIVVRNGDFANWKPSTSASTSA